MSVEAGNEHRAIVLIAAGLITGKDRTLTNLRSHIPETFTKATVAKLGSASKELD